MRWSILLVALLLTLLLSLSGCLRDPNEGDGGDDGGTDGQDGATYQAHGSPQRTQSSVTVEQTQDGRWRADQVVTIQNGVGSLQRASVSLDTVNGATTLTGAATGGYVLTASLFAFADSEQEARDRLAELDVQHEDSAGAGTLDLQSAVVLASDDPLDPVPVDVGGTGQDWQNRGGSLALVAPSDRLYDGVFDTINGAIQVLGASGDSVTADTTNGAVTVMGRWDALDLHTTNGRITFAGGPRTDGDHTYAADTTNGAIAFTLQTSSEHGYDVTADTTNGRIEIRLPDVQDVGQQEDDHRHVRTRDYDERAMRVTLTAETTNGGIDVVGS